MGSNNLGKRTEEAKQRIIRHIWEASLKIGDKLPSVSSLRQELGLGSVTISRAMQALKEDGVVDIVDRVGVFVRRDAADGHTGWQVGVISTRLPANPFVALLLHCVQLELHDRGCSIMQFLRDVPATPKTIHHDTLDDYRGLRRCVGNRLMQGIILMAGMGDDAWDAMEAAGLHPCFIGLPNGSRRAVFLDYPHIIRTGVRALRARGFRRITLVLGNETLSDASRLEIEREIAPLWPESRRAEAFRDVGSLEAAHRAVAHWRALPPEARPEALFIPADVLASWVACAFVRNPGWLPALATEHNSELPIPDIFPVAGFFQVQIAEMAKMAADQLFDYLRNPAEKCETPDIRWYRPEWIVPKNGD